MTPPKLSRQERRRLLRLIAIAEDEGAAPFKRMSAMLEMVQFSESFAPGPLIYRDPDGQIVYADAGDGVSPPVEMGMTQEAADLLEAWQAEWQDDHDPQS